MNRFTYSPKFFYIKSFSGNTSFVRDLLRDSLVSNKLYIGLEIKDAVADNSPMGYLIWNRLNDPKSKNFIYSDKVDLWSSSGVKFDIETFDSDKEVIDKYFDVLSSDDLRLLDRWVNEEGAELMMLRNLIGSEIGGIMSSLMSAQLQFNAAERLSESENIIFLDDEEEEEINEEIEDQEPEMDLEKMMNILSKKNPSIFRTIKSLIKKIINE